MKVKEFLNYCDENTKIFLYETSGKKKFKVYRGKAGNTPEELKNIYKVVLIQSGLTLAVHCKSILVEA